VYGQFMNTCEKKVAFNFGEQGVYKNMHTRRCDNTKKSANSDLTKPDVLTQVDRAAFPSGRQALRRMRRFKKTACFMMLHINMTKEKHHVDQICEFDQNSISCFTESSASNPISTYSTL